MMRTYINIVLIFIKFKLIYSDKSDSYNEKLKKIEESFRQRNSSYDNGFLLLGGEDKYLNTPELLKKYGYPAEEHFVITEDGYNLTLFRSPSTGPAVFLMHGLLSSSDDFISLGPKKALAYILSDQGYDVWLGNARGNKYSKRHISLSSKEKKFWEFSWHEMGFYDSPAIVDKILETTNQEQIIYIGHSQGTTTFFVMTALRPEYNKKIKLCISLAPIAWVWHFKSPIVRPLIPIRKILGTLATALELHEVLPETPVTKFMTNILCNTSRLALITCMTALFAIFGFDYSQVDMNRLPIILSHIPSGSSIQQVIHFSQLIETREFTQFDYGIEENLDRYGTPDPPNYPVQNITTPIVLFYAVNDYLSVFDDVQILADRLPNVLAMYRVPHLNFNHFDYLWAKNVDALVYYQVLKTIKSFL